LHTGQRDRAAGGGRQRDEGAIPAPLDAAIRTRGGEPRAIRWHLTTLAAAGGALACAIGIDVTDERELAHRTRRAERLAALGTLAAGLAHEIRNPLNAAKLQLMLVERRLGKGGPDDRERALEAAAVVRDELGRLAGLVQDFLSFARPTELRPSATDLGAIVRAVVDLIGPEAAEAGVALAAPEGAPALTVVCDPERIKQVVLNLVRNAVEAAGGGGEVTIELAADTATDAAWILVIDTGPGLPPGIDVFEPFATTKDGGTGLGLPIVHRIVASHGGDIEVSRRHQRTVFAIQLPRNGPPARTG
jgi:signal transduction histidine kinase